MISVERRVTALEAEVAALKKKKGGKALAIDPKTQETIEKIAAISREDFDKLFDMIPRIGLLDPADPRLQTAPPKPGDFGKHGTPGASDQKTEGTGDNGRK